MKVEQIVILVVAFALGMLLLNVVKNMCGCELKEGFTADQISNLRNNCGSLYNENDWNDILSSDTCCGGKIATSGRRRGTCINDPSRPPQLVVPEGAPPRGDGEDHCKTYRDIVEQCVSENYPNTICSEQFAVDELFDILNSPEEVNCPEITSLSHCSAEDETYQCKNGATLEQGRYCVDSDNNPKTCSSEICCNQSTSKFTTVDELLKVYPDLEIGGASIKNPLFLQGAWGNDANGQVTDNTVWKDGRYPSISVLNSGGLNTCIAIEEYPDVWGERAPQVIKFITPGCVQPAYVSKTGNMNDCEILNDAFGPFSIWGGVPFAYDQDRNPYTSDTRDPGDESSTQILDNQYHWCIPNLIDMGPRSSRDESGDDGWGTKFGNLYIERTEQSMVCDNQDATDTARDLAAAMSSDAITLSGLAAPLQGGN